MDGSDDMARLTYKSEQEILDTLDHIKDKLHQNVVDYEDSIWMVDTIGKLLLETHFMRNEILMNYKGED